MPLPSSLSSLPPRTLGTLASVDPGFVGTVVGLDGGDTDAVAKLLSLGVVPGMSLSLESVGPAVVFRIGTARFAVDRDLAGAILVQREER